MRLVSTAKDPTRAAQSPHFPQRSVQHVRPPGQMSKNRAGRVDGHHWCAGRHRVRGPEEPVAAFVRQHVHVVLLLHQVLQHVRSVSRVRPEFRRSFLRGEPRLSRRFPTQLDAVLQLAFQKDKNVEFENPQLHGDRDIQQEESGLGAGHQTRGFRGQLVGSGHEA